MTSFLLTVLGLVAFCSLFTYADAHNGRPRQPYSLAVVPSPSPTPSPQPVASEVKPIFADVIIAEQVRTSAPTLSLDGPANVNARTSHHVDELQRAFADLDGRDVEAAVFDNGAIRASHKEFRLDVNDENTSRIKFRVPPVLPPETHATHVAGTMGASGNLFNGRAKGMAPRLKSIYSENMKEDLSGLEVVSRLVSISNHSYTPNAGWSRDSRSGLWVWYGDERVDPAEDSKFGKYTEKESTFDRLVHNSKKLVAFVAAGNDRDQSPEDTQPIDHYVFDGLDDQGRPKSRKVVGATRNKDGFDSNGLDTVVGLCVAKNSVCIGAIPDIRDATAATAPELFESTSYSNWGPTDDGRIKPDLVATGNDLVSASAADDEAIVGDRGTSMASPTAAGIAALLVQLHRRERCEDPFAAVIKAVLIHTAIEAGKKGPDPVFGWGAIDALAAGRVIAGTDRHILMRRSVSLTNPTFQLLLQPTGTTDKIKVTVVWTDPPAQANTGGRDNPDITLMNDLDVKLTAPDGTTVFFPYSLNTGDPLAEAFKDRPNRVDNVEVVDTVGSAPGTWKLEVTATTLRAGQEQDFAIVISGLKAN